MTSPSAASPAASAPRLLWIDLLRGFLMLAIIFDHTEICFTGDNIVPYRMYVPDVLMAFFFLSGYLFYRPEGFRLRHKLHSWLRGVYLHECPGASQGLASWSRRIAVRPAADHPHGPRIMVYCLLGRCRAPLLFPPVAVVCALALAGRSRAFRRSPGLWLRYASSGF